MTRSDVSMSTGSHEGQGTGIPGGMLSTRNTNTNINTTSDITTHALNHVPIPILVIKGDSKCIEAVNNAFTQLYYSCNNDSKAKTTTNINLAGKSLSDIGLELSYSDNEVRVGWDRLLDNLMITASQQETENNTPTENQHKTNIPKNAQVPFVFKPQHSSAANSVLQHIMGQIVISPFIVGRTIYFNLTFVQTSISVSKPIKEANKRHPLSHTKSLFEAHLSDVNQTLASDTKEHESYFSTPVDLKHKSETDMQLSLLQKISIMKNALLDTMKIPVFATWIDGSITIPNKAGLKLAASELPKTSAPLNDLDFLNADWISKFKVFSTDFSREYDISEYPLMKMCRLKKPLKEQVGMLDANGKKHVFDCSGDGILDENGQWIAAMIWLRDVTDVQRQLDKARRSDDERFQMICDHMPQLIWTNNAAGYVDYFSKRWYEYTGAEGDDFGESGWQARFHPDDIAEANKRWTNSLATGEPYNVEYRCLRHDGAWNWMLGSALPVRDADTNVIQKWIGTCTNIEEQVQARAMARKTKEQLRNVMSHAAIAMWQVDSEKRLTLLEGRSLFASDQDSGMAKPRAKDYLGQLMEHVFPDLPEFTSPVDRVLAGEREVYSETYIGKRFYRTSYLPIMNEAIITKGTPRTPDGPGRGLGQIDGVIGVSMDITDRKQQEYELAAQTAENLRLATQESAAKEASRLKSQFLANMSHEIRTPIAGVIGMSEILLYTQLNDEQQEYAENIQRSANALLTVINDILDFSKVESGRLDIEEVQFSLSLVISDVIKMLRPENKKEIQFLSEVHHPICDDMQVMGDPGRVRQILTNLLSNSIKFTTSGFVKLVVKIEKEIQANRKTKGDKASSGKEEKEIYTVVYFEVEDTGIGIEDSVRKRLFQPFGQADSSTARKFGGSGLGLAICKNLVGLMGGVIELQSEYGKGTKAFFKIPFRLPEPGSVNVGDENLWASTESLPERLQNDVSVSCRNSNGSDTAHSDNMSIKSYTKGGESQNMPGSNAASKKEAAYSGTNGEGPASPSLRAGSMSPTSFASSPTDAKPILPTEKRKQLHVLVVEDNHINQQIAIKIVKKLGFSVTAVWNGKEALDYLLEANIHEPQTNSRIPTSAAGYSAAIEEHLKKKLRTEENPNPIPQPEVQTGDMTLTGKIIPDICLMDVHMPVMDGYECTRSIRLLPAPLRDVPIIGLTASAIKGDREKCKDAGMDDYLAKPVRAALLEKMLVKWLSAGPSRQGVSRMSGQTPPLENARTRGGIQLDETSKARRSSLSSTESYFKDNERLSLDEQLSVAEEMGLETQRPE